MRVWIVGHPRDRGEHGVRIDLFQEGRLYDLPASLATFLMAQGWARAEMRLGERRKRLAQRARDRRTGQDRRDH